MTIKTLAQAIDRQFVVLLRTDAETFIGVATVDPEGEMVTIRRGYTGRPAVFPLHDIEAFIVVSNGVHEVDPVNDLTPTGFAVA